MTTEPTNETAEERDVQAVVEKEKFLRELDQAIEERRLTDVMSDLYVFDATEREYTIEVNGVKYKHLLKAPTTVDEMRKEAMSVTIKRNAGRFEGDDMVEAVNDNANARRRFYDALALKVWGYPIEDGDEGEQWIDVTTVVDEVQHEEGKENGHKPTRLLDYIPESDKIKAAGQVHEAPCFVLREKGKRIRSVKSRREYIVKQLFGRDRDEDGGLSRPENVVAYHFNDGTASDIGYFDAKCTTTKTVIKKEDQPEQRTVINVDGAVELFDRLINYVQGASINGEEVGGIAKGDPRLKQIPDRCKIISVFVYLDYLKS